MDGRANLSFADNQKGLPSQSPNKNVAKPCISRSKNHN